LDTSGTKTEGACKDGASEMEVYTVNNKNHLLCKYLIGWQVSGVGGSNQKGTRENIWTAPN